MASLFGCFEYLNLLNQELQAASSSPIAVDNSPLSYLLKGYQDQLAVLRMLSEQCNANMGKLQWITSEINTLKAGNKNYSVIIPREEPIASEFLLEKLCGEAQEWQYSLKLLNDIPHPVFKEKAFSIVAQIVDQEGNKASLPNPVHFKILLFTNENPPKLMETTTNGDKIMRGTVDVESDDVLNYKKIVIKEVTSHYRHGSFFLVVAPKEAPYIKPLIIENLVVKARKVGLDAKPRKKQKIEANQ